MSNSTRQAYISLHAEEAMEQMKTYGIPASVILAQGILESADGKSELSRLGNNHFGIKATQKWIDEGGKFLVYADDKPNEKFCQYASAAESYEHHSRFLKENSRYAELFKLSPEDHKGWAEGLQKAGYATNPNYASIIESIIKTNHLEEYDQKAMEQMKTQREDNSLHYSFPVESKEFLLVTAPFGIQADPNHPGRQQMHKEIDIKAQLAPLLATEDDGKVIAVENDVKGQAGKSVTIEYARDNGDRFQVTCCHLSSVEVKTGDTVQAGQRLGRTGENLSMSVKQVSADGSSRDVDPASYLADIATKGEIKQQVLCNGENLLAKYQPTAPADLSQDSSKKVDTTLSPEDWMKKLMCSEDAGQAMGADSIMDMIVTLFSSLMALALQIDNRSEEEKMQSATEAAVERRIDLSGMVRDADECLLLWPKGNKPVLSVTKEGKTSHHSLSDAEVQSLTATLQNPDKPDAEKQQRLNALVGQIIIRQQASNNYEQTIGQEMSQGMQR